MDADDIAIKERFEKQLAVFNDHPEITIVSSPMEIIDESGKKLNNAP